MEKKLEADTIASNFEIPATRTRKARIKKNDSHLEFEDLSESFDNWKNRGNNGTKLSAQKNDNNKKKSKSKLFFNK